MAPATQGDPEVPVPAPNFSVTGPAAKTAIDQPEEVPIAAPIISVTGGAPPPSKDKIELPDAHDPVTGSGRWLYETKLGEGGLAVVFQAWDTKGGLGQVAVKVLKKHSKAHARHAFAMHRESQWSLQRLHNHSDPRYSESHASLFARYLEDHTGFTDLGPSDFEERRKEYESPKFDWSKHRIILPGKPYVVMELARGETLQTAMDREYRPAKVHDPPCLSQMEKHDVILQCIMALEYLERFCLIHRDFRGCNMQLIARRKDPAPCKLKILDLGVMISAEVGMEKNCNMAVQAFRRRGETEEQRKRYDWLPWEAAQGSSGSCPSESNLPIHLCLEEKRRGQCKSGLFKLLFYMDHLSCLQLELKVRIGPHLPRYHESLCRKKLRAENEALMTWSSMEYLREIGLWGNTTYLKEIGLWGSMKYLKEIGLWGNTTYLKEIGLWGSMMYLREIGLWGSMMYLREIGLWGSITYLREIGLWGSITYLKEIGLWSTMMYLGEIGLWGIKIYLNVKQLRRLDP
ncbi:unnamed protein product [Symbiodinium sp. CCMP2592]|nr:unnamed protein product [Symbiodinium sp. CCMP2592]